MTDSVNRDPRFRTWLAERAPRVAPPDLLARSITAAVAAPQAGRLALRWPLLRFAAPAAATVVLFATIATGLLLSRVPNVGLAPSASTAASATLQPAPEATTQPTPSATRSPTPSLAPPVASPPSAHGAWTRSDMPDPAPGEFGGGTPIGVVRFQDGYVAIGAAVTEYDAADDESRTVVWTSSDGATWQLHDDVAGFPRAGVRDLVTDGDRLLAIGITVDTVACCHPEPAAWLSTDGLSWTRVAGPVPSIVAVGPHGFVGAVVENAAVRFATSTDGRSWAAASDRHEGDVADLAVDATGRAIAIGHVTVPSDVDESYTTNVVVWRSADGSSWSEPEIVAEDAVARAVTGGPAGFVVVGQQYGMQRDGTLQEVPRIWRLGEAGLDPVSVTFGDNQSLSRIDHVGDSLVATGEEAVDGLANVMVWVSTDGGATWARVSHQVAFDGTNSSVTGVAPAPGGLIAVGRRWDSLSGHLVPVAWSSAR